MTIETLKDQLTQITRESAKSSDVRVRTISSILHTVLAAILGRDERALCDLTAGFSEAQIKRISASRN